MAAPVSLGYSRLPDAIRGRPGRKLRLLVLAEECNPWWSSVPLVGYNFARALAARADLDVTVVTSVRNRQALEGDPLAGQAELHYIDTEAVAGPAFRLARRLRGGEALGWTINTALSWPAYLLFEHRVLRRFRLRADPGRFDLIHRVTPVSPTLGSPLTSWTETPMVLGPLNGGLPWPAEFPELRRREREWLSHHRGLHRILPYHGSTYRLAAGVLAASRYTAGDLPPGPGARRYLPENGVDPARFPILDAWRPAEGPFRFVVSGRVAPVKAIDLILRAIGGSESLRRCVLTVVGDGPDRARLEGLAADLGLGGAVEFAGWLTQEGLADQLRRAQAFVFPSIKDFGGGAVAEAMASGLPTIVTDYGGPAELVTAETGLKLPLAPADRMVASLRAAMESLAGDPALCRRLGEAAARRARARFTWSAKAEALVRFYREVLAARAAGPVP